nr:efflux RND transporter permease subunit [Bacteroidales bacterium]
MVRFLLKRPIAVSMTYIAILMLGLVAVFQLPVSLMPDIDIPEITVQVDGKNMPVRQLENALVRPMRQQLIQVSHLEAIQSETSDQTAIIKLRFEYGTDIDLAFIDVNEKIDRSMNYLPKDVKRPRVIKASASDIPVFLLNITAKESYLTNQEGASTDLTDRFAELSRFSSQVIKKRIEQLSEIAMADISGTIVQEIIIEPYKQKLVSLGIDYSDIENAIVEHNIELGNIIVKDGIYQYNLRFQKIIEDKSDIENILLQLEGKSIKLKEIADVKVKPQKRIGLITANKSEAVALAVIKKSGARMQDMKISLKKLVSSFKQDYPDINFEIIRDQSRILDYSINNLSQTLLLGAVLAFLIMFLFLRDMRSPFLIGLSIPSSLIISVLFFYFLDISINIISLSGLVLGVGMMIDNSIIVIDNITQNIDRGKSLQASCINGTNVVIRPLLTSVFTTCAVFIPLIFISGIAGALFFDQAMAVTIGLFVSFIVSITLVPVYYKLFSKNGNNTKISFLHKIKLFDYFNIYEKVLFYVFRHQRFILIVIMLFIILGACFYKLLDKEKLPIISEDELFVSVDWNEKIHVEENKLRSLELINGLDSSLAQSSTYVGTQDFVMQHDNLSSPREAKIYLKLKDPKYLPLVTGKINRFFEEKYVDANYEILPPENVFELLFPNEKYSLIAQIIPFQKNKELVFSELNELLKHFPDGLNAAESSSIPTKEYINILLNSEKLLIYDISRTRLINKLKSLFSELQISEIRGSQDYMPIIFGNKKENLSKLLN